MNHIRHFLSAVLLAAAALLGTTDVHAQAASHIGYFTASDDGGIRQVYQVGVSPNTAPRVVTHAASDVLAYGAAYDGLSVAYVADGQLWLQPIHTDSPEALTKLASTDFLGSPVFSPDGQYVAYTDDGIALLDLGTRQTRSLVANIPLDASASNMGKIRSYRPIQFVMDANGKASKLAVSIGLWESQTVGLIDLATGAVQELADRSHHGLLSITANRVLLYGNTPVEGDAALHVVPQLDDINSVTRVADFRQVSPQNLYASSAALIAPTTVRVAGTSFDGSGAGVFTFDYDLSFGRAGSVHTIPLTPIANEMSTVPGALSPDGRLLTLDFYAPNDAAQVTTRVLDLATGTLVLAALPNGAADFQWQPQ